MAVFAVGGAIKAGIGFCENSSFHFHFFFNPTGFGPFVPVDLLDIFVFVRIRVVDQGVLHFGIGGAWGMGSWCGY